MEPTNAIEHELKETKKALEAEKKSHATTRQKYFAALQEVINEVQYAYNQTNLPYYGRRVKEAQERYAVETK